MHLRKFDPSTIADDKVIVMVGKRGTGKSWLVQDLLYHKNNIPIGTVISPTESSNTFYSNIVPGLFIHDEYTPELLENVVRRQKLIMKKINREKRLYGNCAVDPRAFLILDDCLYDGVWRRCKHIRYLFMNGRHVNIMMIITLQYPLGVPPELRTNVDYTFVLRENNVNNRRRIYENYASVFPTFEMFCSVLDQLTDGYGCLVIDNTTRSNKLEDNVFWYQAEKHPPFTVGSKEFWDMHHQNMANRDQEDDAEDLCPEEELFDVSSFWKRKSAGPMISVKKLHHAPSSSSRF